MNENERIRVIRKTLKLTTTKFGEAIGISNSAVSNIENGIRGVTDQVCRAVCREFGVSEEWLRTGIGEMFVPEDSISLDEFAKQHHATKLELSFLKAYFQLSPETRREIMDSFSAVFAAAADSVPTIHGMTREEFMARWPEEARQAQRKGESSTSSSSQSFSA